LGELYEDIKLCRKYNYLKALVKLLRDENLDHVLSPNHVADLITLRNFASEQMRVVKAKVNVSGIDSQLRVLRASRRPVPTDLLRLKAELQYEIEDWESYEFWEWYKSLEEIRNSPEFQKRSKSFLARQGRQYLDGILKRKPDPKRRARDKMIWAVIQTGAKGLAYCRALDARGIKGNWEGFGGYETAYKQSKRFCQLINKEKNRVARRMQKPSPTPPKVSAKSKS
jgi:hypothetical protein